MNPVMQPSSSLNIQRNVSNMGSNNPMFQKQQQQQQQPLYQLQPQMPNQIFQQQKPDINPIQPPPVYFVAPSLTTSAQIPMFSATGQYNLQMPAMGPMPYPMQYPMPQAPFYYYPTQAPQLPRSTPLIIPTLNTNRSFINGPELKLPTPISIDSKAYEPPKTYPLALPSPESTRPLQLYKLEKPVIVVDSLKHPSDKYKDLIYKPKYLTSRNIDPPTEELVPKVGENDDDLPPLPSFVARNASKINIDIHLRYPSSKSLLENPSLTSRNPTLVGDLKLPHKPLAKEPTLVGDLKLPIERVRIFQLFSLIDSLILNKFIFILAHENQRAHSRERSKTAC